MPHPLSAESATVSFRRYAQALGKFVEAHDWSQVAPLALEMNRAWDQNRQVFICGNGGSAANAIHWANDFIYPVAKKRIKGIRFSALAANPAVLTCLGNDLSYEDIFSYQLGTLAQAGDLLILLSGSGNSPNILSAIAKARSMDVTTAGLFGFDGGRALPLVDIKIHFPVHDMQLAEDLQMVVCHMLMRCLAENHA
ncbi:MAG: SIS domain-containing protein [Verrucomicrobiae bacterium]|nr:SIS domain-containing protein [Verrucomicrobiae bacterium]